MYYHLSDLHMYRKKWCKYNTSYAYLYITKLVYNHHFNTINQIPSQSRYRPISSGYDMPGWYTPSSIQRSGQSVEELRLLHRQSHSSWRLGVRDLNNADSLEKRKAPFNHTPGKNMTCPPNIDGWKMHLFIENSPLFWGHVSFKGCKFWKVIPTLLIEGKGLRIASRQLGFPWYRGLSQLRCGDSTPAKSSKETTPLSRLVYPEHVYQKNMHI